MRIIPGLVLTAVLAGSAVAGDIPTEVATLKGQKITLHVHPFLTDEELKMLRLVQTNKQALQLFVTSGGFSAIAVAPEEGFVRDGGLVPSAIAIGDLPSAEAAAEAALKACDAARKAALACVVVLEVAPAT